MNRNLIVILGLLASAACSKEKEETSVIRTEAVRRRTIVVSAEATGVVEPVNVVEVKSKASGQINRMTVETGSDVQPGDLLVQLDTRDVVARYNQAKADWDAAKSRLDVALETRRRQRQLFQERIITEQEFQQGLADSSSSAGAFIRAGAALDIAEQQRDDATVRAPIAGTIIDKTVSVGSVITSSTGSMGAGTTLLKMADLSRVRVRAHFNETDIGNVQPGLAATVTVDAFPDAPFRGIVEKIEPIAVVQQSVTMFPVLIALDNAERKLKPGMNGEVAVRLDERSDVLAVASDAIRTLREAESNALLLKLNPDSVRKQVDAQIASLGTGGGPVAENSPGTRTSRGDVDLSAPAFQQTPQQTPQQQAGQQTPQQGGGRGGQRGGPPPTLQECQPIAAAFAKSPKVKARIDSLRASMRSGGDRGAIMAEMRTAYGTLGVDERLAGRCQSVLNPQAGGDAGAARGGARGATTPTQGRTTPGAASAAAGAGQTPGGRSGGGGGFGGGGGRSRGRGGDGPTGPRTSLVFVSVSGKYEPRVIRTGLSSYDYTEVVSGLTEGDEVVLLTTAQLQQQQQQQRDQMRARQGGPLGAPAPGGGGPPGGGRGPGGGGNPGGGGGGGGGGRPPGGN